MTEGNRLWLVCSAHPDTDNGLMLGQRRGAEYHRAPSAGHINDWFEKHADCATEPDHFKLAHSQTPNYDVDPVISPENHVGAAVRVALVKA